MKETRHPALHSGLGRKMGGEAKWVVLLLLVSLVWGTTFVLVKDTLASFGTFALLALRFGLASIILGGYLLLSGAKITKSEMKYGAILGIFLFIGFGAQTLGLNYTSPTSSAFVTNLYVLFVPLLSAVLLRKMPQRKIWVATAIALAGLFLLTSAGGSFGVGDAWTLLCALGFALQILFLSKYARGCEPIHLAFVEIFAVALISSALMFPMNQIPTSYPLPALGAIAFLALFATIFAQSAQAMAQKRLEAPKVAIILITEPLFAACFSFLFAGELFSGQKLLGAALILAALFIAEYEKIRI